MFYIDPKDYLKQQTGKSEKVVDNLLSLIADGATIPFIARYRKEMTNSMDEVAIEEFVDCYKKYKELEARKKTILDTISSQEQLTPELERDIVNCIDSTRLEDLYLPFKPKRLTKAAKAKAKGLEPLADAMMLQPRGFEALIENYLNDDVETVEEALQGARDIVAERISEKGEVRKTVRKEYQYRLVLKAKVVKGKEEEGEKYRDYFDFSQELKRITSHRMLALLRGENEGIIRLSFEGDDERILRELERQIIRYPGVSGEQLKLALRDGYNRLLVPSILTEMNKEAKEKADKEAIAVFVKNLRELLLASPVGNRPTLAIDPGYRTGCKVVVLDSTGNLRHYETLFFHSSATESTKALSILRQLLVKNKIEVVAIGNGTAGRETDTLIQPIVRELGIECYTVNESGASIYSASKVAREEFPDQDVTVRGAVSIGRRLQDPLAELVKIDPKSIGVGQYQHDVDQNDLKEALDRVVESCVNQVGVSVNNATRYILRYISGLGPVLAMNIEEYIRENGPLKSRKELLKVKRMGAKSFEQCAGFLRIENGKNPLDNSAVHPENYKLVEAMAASIGVNVKDLIANESLCNQIDLKSFQTNQIGMITLNTLISELKKPTRDPRQQAEMFSFSDEVKEFADIKVGMILPGIVNNLTNFGAFVDIGIKEGGLLHLSQIADRYISAPSEVLSIHQHVTVEIIEVDEKRRRIGLRMKGIPQK